MIRRSKPPAPGDFEPWTAELKLRDRPHTLLAPQGLRISAQRLAALGDDRLELLLTGAVEGSGRFETLGASQMTGLVDAAVNGELLAAVSSATGSSGTARVAPIPRNPRPAPGTSTSSTT